MKDVLNLGLRLLLITLVAGLLLGGTYVITKEPTEAQAIEAAQAARKAVLDADSFEQMDLAEVSANEEYASVTDIYIGKDAAGNVVGATIQMSAKGFNPGIALTVGISADGTISGVNIGENEETPGLGARATEEAFYGQYAGQKADGNLVVEKNGAGDGRIQAIAGATITSRGVTEAVNLAARCYAAYIAQ